MTQVYVVTSENKHNTLHAHIKIYGLIVRLLRSILFIYQMHVTRCSMLQNENDAHF